MHPRDIPSDTPSLFVAPWPDPVIDQVGHDPRSVYVERFWLGILGPSATWLVRHLVDRLDRAPDGCQLDLDECATALGLGRRPGAQGVFPRTLARCCQFGATRLVDAGHAAGPPAPATPDPAPDRPPPRVAAGRPRPLDGHPAAGDRRRHARPGASAWRCRSSSWARTAPAPNANCTAGASTRPSPARRPPGRSTATCPPPTTPRPDPRCPGGRRGHRFLLTTARGHGFRIRNHDLVPLVPEPMTSPARAPLVRPFRSRVLAVLAAAGLVAGHGGMHVGRPTTRTPRTSPRRRR